MPMIAINPIASMGARSFQPIQAVTPVVRGFGNAATNPRGQALQSSADRVTLNGNAPRAGDDLYTRKGTLVSSTERQESFELTIQTAEGDTATLRLSQSTGSSSTVSAQSSARGSTVEWAQEQYGTLDAQVSVQGSLNAQEQQAIDRLVQDINKVADRFFAGNTQAANAQADTLKMQDAALSGFSLNLRRQEMSRVSAVYEDVARFTAPPPPASPPPTAQQNNADLLKGLKQLLVDNPK
jgi:hypothetical protein